MHTLRHVHEAATAPDSAVQRSKLVVRWRNNCAEVLLHDVWIEAQGSIHIGKDNADLLKVLTHFMIDGLTLILSSHTCQELALGLGNTQAIKCIFNLSRNFFPCFTLFLYRLDVIENVVEVNSREVSAPGWHWTFLKKFQALEAELTHPIGFSVHLGDMINDFATQSSFRLKRVVFGYMEARTIVLLLHIEYLTHRLHSILYFLLILTCVLGFKCIIGFLVRIVKGWSS